MGFYFVKQPVRGKSPRGAAMSLARSSCP